MRVLKVTPMGDICKLETPATLVPIRVQQAATPARRINLKTQRDVQREMARVYRDMRTRALDSQEGTRLTYVLSMIGKTIAEADASKASEMTYEDYLHEIHAQIEASRTQKNADQKI